MVELLIGVAGLLFHGVFLGYTQLSQELVYPSLDSAPAIAAWQWGTAALLIAPQTVLLGMTFPLMSGGYLRMAPRADGEILGGLYFSNSLGAALGALVATFVLLPWIGMPGAMVAGGVINLLVAAGAWRVARRVDGAGQDIPGGAVGEAKGSRPVRRMPVFVQIMLIAAGLSGATSFVYEIGWIRMLNQSLGTTMHSFELMLAAFILGLAFGGWWVRKHSRAIHDAVARAGLAQVWKGVAALISIPIFGLSFYWVGALVQMTPKTDAGYVLFSLGSGAIALLVMFPAAFFAGMTLPLFTMALLRKQHGEASIGRVYAANTLGAIVGVFAATHVLIPLMGLRLAITVAAVVDIVLGFYLLRRVSLGVAVRPMAVALAVSVVVIGGSLQFGKLNPYTLASGVFRHGNSELKQSADVQFLRDGKTATVAFYTEGSTGIIATNGKPDAGIQLNPDAPPSLDEITMIMAAALPLAAHPDPEEIAIIGWGSGLSTHTVLGSERPQAVDSIEIERAMVDGARWYGPLVERAYTDPRSYLHIDDARTFFSTGKRSYDVIVSEPSNPWVSGVASLFTREFYAFLRSHLKPGGLLVQWVQSYEIDDPLMFTMMAALLEEFPYVEAYLSNTSDVLLLSGMEPVGELDMRRIDTDGLRPVLTRVGLNGPGDYAVRKIGSRSTLEALAALYGAKPHSDFYPEVSLNAPRTRFKKDSVESFINLMSVGMPLLEMTDGRVPASVADEVTPNKLMFSVSDHLDAVFVRARLLGEDVEAGNDRQETLEESLDVVLQGAQRAVADEDLPKWLAHLAQLADFSIGYLPPRDHRGVWTNPGWLDLDEQNDAVQAVMAAYAAAANRDGPAMQKTALNALEILPEDTPGMVREQMLVSAVLGAIQDGDFEEAARIEEDAGHDILASNRRYLLARAYLMAWLDVN